MPETDVIIYTVASAAIVLLITIIGALLMLGFNGIKEELKGLREDIKAFDNEKTFLRAEIAAIKANCAAQRDAGFHLHHRADDIPRGV